MNFPTICCMHVFLRQIFTMIPRLSDFWNFLGPSKWSNQDCILIKASLFSVAILIAHSWRIISFFLFISEKIILVAFATTHFAFLSRSSFFLVAIYKKCEICFIICHATLNTKLYSFFFHWSSEITQLHLDVVNFLWPKFLQN